MSDLKLTPSLLAMLERIERHSGSLLMLAVTASGGQYGKLNKLRGAGYVVKWVGGCRKQHEVDVGGRASGPASMRTDQSDSPYFLLRRCPRQDNPEDKVNAPTVLHYRCLDFMVRRAI